MEYENPEIPEGINTSKAHPVKTFLTLLAGLVVVLLLCAWLLGLSGGYLASKIPYSQEKRLAESYQVAAAPDTPLQRYLQQLADRVSIAMALDPSMSISIHYVDEPVENAFATIGGNVFLYRGLLEKLPNENALAMLMAHEIAHVAHRDPIVSAGQSAAISTGMMLLLGGADKSLLGSAGLLTQMNFSRDMETSADEAGLQAVQRIYGHVNGALDLYHVLNDVGGTKTFAEPEFFSTHPQSGNRIEVLMRLAKAKGWDSRNSKTPLPDTFSLWLSGR